MYSAGYDLVNAYDEVWARLTDVMDWSRVKVLHLNDSKTPLASKRDRHELIAEGSLGELPFRRIMNVGAACFADGQRDARTPTGCAASRRFIVWNAWEFVRSDRSVRAGTCANMKYIVSPRLAFVAALGTALPAPTIIPPVAAKPSVVSTTPDLGAIAKEIGGDQEVRTIGNSDRGEVRRRFRR